MWGGQLWSGVNVGRETGHPCIFAARVPAVSMRWGLLRADTGCAVGSDGDRTIKVIASDGSRRHLRAAPARQPSAPK